MVDHRLFLTLLSSFLFFVLKCIFAILLTKLLSIVFSSKNYYWQKQPPEVFYKKGVLKNSVEFAGKLLCQSLFFNKLAGLTKKQTVAEVPS